MNAPGWIIVTARPLDHHERRLRLRYFRAPKVSVAPLAVRVGPLRPQYVTTAPFGFASRRRKSTQRRFALERGPIQKIDFYHHDPLSTRETPNLETFTQSSLLNS